MPHNNNVSIDLASLTFLYRDENYAYIILNKKLIKYKIVAKNQINPNNIILKMIRCQFSSIILDCSFFQVWQNGGFKFVKRYSSLDLHENFDEKYKLTFNKNYASLKLKELTGKIYFPE
jgi:hypothetical protein